MRINKQLIWKLFLEVFLPLIILSGGLILVLNFQKKGPDNPDFNKIIQLSRCLKENGWSMYGENSCPYCQQQRAMFGAAFSNINFVDCTTQSELCEKNGISKYPVWEKDGKSHYGVYNLKDLAAFSGCKYQ